MENISQWTWDPGLVPSELAQRVSSDPERGGKWWVTFSSDVKDSENWGQVDSG